MSYTSVSTCNTIEKKMTLNSLSFVNIPKPVQGKRDIIYFKGRRKNRIRLYLARPLLDSVARLSRTALFQLQLHLPYLCSFPAPHLHQSRLYTGHVGLRFLLHIEFYWSVAIGIDSGLQLEHTLRLRQIRCFEGDSTSSGIMLKYSRCLVLVAIHS